MKKSIVKIRAPKGFYFKIIDVSCDYSTRNKTIIYHVNLFDRIKNQCIGSIELIKHSSSKFFETHSELNHEYHNQGFGVLMYSKAIQFCLKKGFKVSSSGSSSEAAVRMWNGKRIRKHFSLRKRVDSCGIPKWFAYNKVF